MDEGRIRDRDLGELRLNWRPLWTHELRGDDTDAVCAVEVKQWVASIAERRPELRIEALFGESLRPLNGLVDDRSPLVDPRWGEDAGHHRIARFTKLPEPRRPIRRHACMISPTVWIGANRWT